MDRDDLQLGRPVAFVTERSGEPEKVDGTVIFRDANTVRIMPTGVSDRALEFKMINGNEFIDPVTLPVTHPNDTTPPEHYVKILGVKEGDVLEFFTLDGTKADDEGTVAFVIASETPVNVSDLLGEDVGEILLYDAVILDDGRIIDFGFVGPPASTPVVRVSNGSATAKATEATEAEATGAEATGAEATGAEATGAEATVAEATDADIKAEQEFLFSLMSENTLTKKAVASADKRYDDSVQRKDLYDDLIADEKRARDRRVARRTEREADLAISLKNKALLNGNFIATVATLQDAINTSQDAVPIAIPIVSAAKVLNMDAVDAEFNASDVFPRVLGDHEREAVAMANTDDTDGYKEFDLATYMYTMFSTETSLHGDEGEGWREDQDVIRTATYGAAIQGLDRNPLKPGLDLKVGKDVVLYALSEGLSKAVKGDRISRVLTRETYGNSRIPAPANPSTVLIPSDPSVVVGHVILPSTQKLRIPKRPRNLAVSIQYATELDNDLSTLDETIHAQYSDTPSPDKAWTLDTDEPIAKWITSITTAVRPGDLLAPRTPQVLGFLDAFGVGNNTPSMEVATIIWSAIANAQKEWEAIRPTAPGPAEPRTFSGDAQIWTHLYGSAALKDVLDDIRKRNPAIYESPTVLTSSLLTEADGDAMPIVWWEIAGLDGRSSEGVAAPVAGLVTSRAYIERRRYLKDKILMDLAALNVRPEVNDCPHVKVLEAIRSIEDVVDHGRQLEEFLSTYKEGVEGAWVMCNKCHKECVCMHEVRQLDILRNPAEADAIQRSIMKEFGGERYEGKIICRNCYQPLQDIDYDDHIEFDDAGRAILTSSVLTAEQLEPLNTKNLFGATESKESTYVAGLSERQKGLFSALKAIMTQKQQVVVRIRPAIIERIVAFADEYLEEYSKKAKLFADLKEKNPKIYAAQLAALKKKAYDNVLPNEEDAKAAGLGAVVALIALVVELDPGSIVITPPTGSVCVPSRETSADPWKSGVLNYVACIANVAMTSVIPAAFTFKGDPRGTLKLLNHEAIRVGLVSATPTSVVETTAAEPSPSTLHTEFIPTGFRPVSLAMAEPLNPDALVQLSQNGSLEAVSDALRVKNIAHIANLHKNTTAATGIAMKSTEGTCCRTDMSIWNGPEAGQSETLLRKYYALRREAPALVANGALFKPAFVLPASVVAVGKENTDEMIKLFFKYCYDQSKPSVGNPHEFSFGNQCRRCGFALGKSPDLVVESDRIAIFAAQTGTLHIEADLKSRFDLLSRQVRARLALTEGVMATPFTWRQNLEVLAASAAGIPEFATALRTILSEPVPELSGTEKASQLKTAAFWRPVSAIKQTVFPAAAGSKSSALSIMMDLTADPFVEGPRLLQEYFCARVNAAVKDYVPSIKGASWAGVAPTIDTTMTKLFTANSEWLSKTTQKEPLVRLATTLAPVLDTWIKVVRQQNKDNVWTTDRAQLVLIALIAAACKGISPDIVRAILIHAKTQHLRYSNEEVKRILQLRAAEERALILSEFDAISDKDERAIALTLKQLGIGRWAIGKNITKLDKDVLLFEEEQRARMGVVDETVVAAPWEEAPEVGDEAYEVDQGAEGDDY